MSANRSIDGGGMLKLNKANLESQSRDCFEKGSLVDAVKVGGQRGTGVFRVGMSFR